MRRYGEAFFIDASRWRSPTRLTAHPGRSRVSPHEPSDPQRCDDPGHELVVVVVPVRAARFVASTTRETTRRPAEVASRA